MSQKCSKEKWELEEEKIEIGLSKYKISNNCENWYKATCPNCNTPNWILMSRDMEACECHKCNEAFWISQDIYDSHKTSLVMGKVFDHNSKLVEDIFIGMEKPN